MARETCAGKSRGFTHTFSSYFFGQTSMLFVEQSNMYHMGGSGKDMHISVIPVMKFFLKVYVF